MPHHAPNPRLFQLMRRKHRRSLADDHDPNPDGPFVMAPAGTVDPTDPASLERRWEDPATVMASVVDLVDRASATGILPAGTLPASTDPPPLPTDLPESSMDSPTWSAPTVSIDVPAPTLSASASLPLDSTTSLPLSAQTSRPLVSSTVSPVSSSIRPSSLNASTATPATSLPTSTPMSTATTDTTTATTTHTSSSTSSTSTTSDDTTTTTTAYATETDVAYWGGGGTGTAGTGSTPSSTGPPPTSPGPPDSGKIAGGVVGGVAGAMMVVFVLLVLLKRWRKLGLRPAPDEGMLGAGQMPRETTQTRRLSREPLFAAATLAPTFLRPWRASRQSTVTAETTLSSSPSERGFQKISGRKIESVLQSGGDGYDGRFGEQQPPHSPTLSEPSMGLGSSPVQPRSPMSAGSISPSIPPPSMPFGMALDTSYTREAEEPGIMVLRPSPARTRGLCPRDGVGRSHPSFDGSKGSRFTESI
ncbi:hypothetical protein BDW42DRAFT_174535 [Aspergillus taichungensis]|uniref:Uncharacterized protein n=1 Tax=Aspergillus taichungensis TaxID=482145 RepID=A0A2J5HN46_9EURO|nr:hypothetical protein BDW42DRAFT_174535 [Aspergillus taichungensis]